jgi:hypothetical protein
MGKRRLNGFLPVEKQELWNSISPEGYVAPYLQKLIHDRKYLYGIAFYYKWSDLKLHRHINKIYQKYGIDIPVNASNFWKLFRIYKDKFEKNVGLKYETPRAKQANRKGFIKTTPADKKRQMDRDRIQDRLKRVNKELSETKSMAKFDSLTAEKERLEKD